MHYFQLVIAYYGWLRIASYFTGEKRNQVSPITSVILSILMLTGIQNAELKGG